MREQRLQAFKIKWEELTHPDRTTKWKNGKETYKKCKDSDLDDTQETGTFLTSAYTRTNADYSKRLICLLKIKDLSLTLFECIYFRKFVISFSLWNACNFFFFFFKRNKPLARFNNTECCSQRLEPSIWNVIIKEESVPFSQFLEEGTSLNSADASPKVAKLPIVNIC